MNAVPSIGVTAQLRASDPRVSAWVDASAGTGKTTVLTERVLRLLLDGAAPERILCITFTRAAAAEMSNRIIRRLGDWAVMPDAGLVDSLFTLTGARPDAASQTRARQLFARIVDAPAGFRIQTIHAFCQSVLRRFPLEARVAPHFDLLDDRTGGELLADARQSVLIEAGRDPSGALGQALAVLVAYMDDRGFGALLQTVVQARRMLTGTIEAHGGVGLLIPRMWRGLGLEPGMTADAILDEACRDESFDGHGLRLACGTLSGASATDQGRAGKISAWLALAAIDRTKSWQTYVSAFLTQAGSPSGSFARTKAHKAMAHILEPEAERLVEVADRLKCALTARATEAMLVVADALFQLYARLKDARSLLDYDDLIETTRRLIESDASWVLYKLDGGIDHLLLDEAQDTNPEQWAIIRGLAAEFFAGLGARDAKRTIFVVGDGKQSIYSFQGADPDALKAMREHFSRQLSDIDQKLEAVDLHKSFRSTEPVLRLVDSVFANPAAYDGVHEDLENPIRHDLARIGQAGLVELWPAIEPEEAGDSAEPWALPDLPHRLKNPETELANKIADAIQGWIMRGDRVAPGGPPIAAGDIMILVRRRTRFVAPMVRALKTRQVPVAGIDRLALTEPLAVQDLIALGRFLLLPEDDLTLAALLKSPLIGIVEDDLFTLAYGRPGSLWNALLAAAERDAPKFGPPQAWLAALLSEVDFLRPHELYAQLLARPCPGDSGPGGSGRRALWRRLGPDALDPLDEFLSAALDYERRHAPTLEGFIAWLEASDAEIKRELAGRGDAVRIVTVHGAKGLEAPIVFLPDTTQLPSPDTGPRLLWHADGNRPIPYWSPRADIRPEACATLADEARRANLKEYRRLLYVALTRARDQLYVCGWQGARKPGEGNWHELVEAGMLALDAERIDDGEHTLLRLSCPGRASLLALPASESGPPAPLPDWARREAPAEPRPFRPLAPSRLEMPGAPEPAPRSPATAGEAARFRRGKALHRLLQLLPDLPAQRRVAAAERHLAEFPKTERLAMSAEALSVIENPVFAKLFGQGSLAEVPIVGRVGSRGVAGRVDRLLVEADRVTIIDFKTGRIPAAGPDAVPTAYLGQMAAYRAVLRQIYPDHLISLVLVWTDGPALVTLDPLTLDPFEAYLTSTVDTAPSPNAA